MIFVGYPLGEKGRRFYDWKTNRFIPSWGAHFVESHFPYKHGTEGLDAIPVSSESDFLAKYDFGEVACGSPMKQNPTLPKTTRPLGPPVIHPHDQPTQSPTPSKSPSFDPADTNSTNPNPTTSGPPPSSPVEPLSHPTLLNSWPMTRPTNSSPTEPSALDVDNSDLRHSTRPKVISSKLWDFVSNTIWQNGSLTHSLYSFLFTNFLRYLPILFNTLCQL